MDELSFTDAIRRAANSSEAFGSLMDPVTAGTRGLRNVEQEIPQDVPLPTYVAPEVGYLLDQGGVGAVLVRTADGTLCRMAVEDARRLSSALRTTIDDVSYLEDVRRVRQETGNGSKA
jgi:hypothetical protein